MTVLVKINISYVSFLEKLVEKYPYGSKLTLDIIESRWNHYIAEDTRPAAAEAITKYFQKYGNFHSNPEHRADYTQPLKWVSYYSLPFVNKGPLRDFNNLRLLYEFFFKPVHIETKKLYRFTDKEYVITI